MSMICSRYGIKHGDFRSYAKYKRLLRTETPVDISRPSIFSRRAYAVGISADLPAEERSSVTSLSSNYHLGNPNLLVLTE